MVLDNSLLNTQHYKVRFKGKVELSRERSSAPTLHLGVVAIEKGDFGSPSTKTANFTLLISLMGRVFTNGPRDRGLVPGRVIPKAQKMVLDTSLLYPSNLIKLSVKWRVSRVKWRNQRKGVALSSALWCTSY